MQDVADFRYAEQRRRAASEVDGVDGRCVLFILKRRALRVKLAMRPSLEVVLSPNDFSLQGFQKPVFQLQGRQRIETAVTAFRLAEGDVDVDAGHD